MNHNSLSFLDNYKNILGNIAGLTEEEIQQLEMDFEVKLPSVYKEFLMRFGKESGYLLSSYYVETIHLKENRDEAMYALNFDDRKKTEDRPTVKDSYFFFAQWQGGIFFFFDCAEEKENPPIYIFEDSLKIYLYKESFVDFLRDEGLKPLLDALG